MTLMQLRSSTTPTSFCTRGITHKTWRSLGGNSRHKQEVLTMRPLINYDRPGRNLNPSLSGTAGHSRCYQTYDHPPLYIYISIYQPPTTTNLLVNYSYLLSKKDLIISALDKMILLFVISDNAGFLAVRQYPISVRWRPCWDIGLWVFVLWSAITPSTSTI